MTHKQRGIRGNFDGVVGVVGACVADVGVAGGVVGVRAFAFVGDGSERRGSGA